MSYKFIAPMYDFLTYYTFMGKIQQAKRSVVPYVQPNQKVLLVGEGTGQLLQYLDELKFTLQVDYVESSEDMIKIAKGRKLTHINANFYTLPFEGYSTGTLYDIIIIPFFLDQFGFADCLSILSKLETMLKKEGILAIADFQVQKCKLWQKTAIRVLYIFFNFTTALKQHSLTGIFEVLRRLPFKMIKKDTFCKGFIATSIWQKV